MPFSLTENAVIERGQILAGSFPTVVETNEIDAGNFGSLAIMITSDDASNLDVVSVKAGDVSGTRTAISGAAITTDGKNCKIVDIVDARHRYYSIEVGADSGKTVTVVILKYNGRTHNALTQYPAGTKTQVLALACA